MAVSPRAYLNGSQIGNCKYGEPLEVSVAPGHYTVSTTSESDNARTFAIDAGETAYVRCKMTPGVLVPNVDLEFFNEAEGAAEVAKRED